MENKILGLIAGHSGDSLTDELHKLGYSVAIVCGKENEPGSDAADHCFICDLEEKDKILSFFKNHGVKNVVMGTGVYVGYLLAEYLEKNGILTSIDVEKSLIVKDKILTKKKFEEISVKTPRYVYYEWNDMISPEEIIKSIGLPCVIKSNLDAIEPQCANTYDELVEGIEEVKRTHTTILIEECIQGGDTTYVIAFDGKHVTHIGAVPYSKSKEYGLKGFKAPYPAQLSEKELAVLEEISEKIMRHIGVVGLCRVDYVISNDNYYALEVNSVIVTGYHGHSYPFFLQKGHNVAEHSVRTALNVFENKKESLLEI